MLAYYHYPFVPSTNVREYTAEELKDPETVEELFDYCQILEAGITRSGWRFLIGYYGYDKLHEIDKRSGWLSDKSRDDTLEEYIEWVRYEMDCSSEE